MKILESFDSFSNRNKDKDFSESINESFFDDLKTEQISEITRESDYKKAKELILNMLRSDFYPDFDEEFDMDYPEMSSNEWEVSTPDERLYHLKEMIEFGESNLNGGHGRQICKECDSDMAEGFVIDGETYCSEECRRVDYTDEEYDEKYNSDDNDEAYWTQWF